MNTSDDVFVFAKMRYRIYLCISQAKVSFFTGSIRLLLNYIDMSTAEQQQMMFPVEQRCKHGLKKSFALLFLI